MPMFQDANTISSGHDSYGLHNSAGVPNRFLVVARNCPLGYTRKLFQTVPFQQVSPFSGGDERVPLVTQYQQNRTHVPAETENTVSLTFPSLPDTAPYNGKTRHAKLLIDRVYRIPL
ncbi:unnamed protein product [Danaus chrysippus]|uniref:(African queen) hypothetical protein n=1 Tax=Danaus chrysippus TaxID=151541 RepID=A0A8J2VSA1_9NEOP|nr:unnamed protein product [Danaus chrysippus]